VYYTIRAMLQERVYQQFMQDVDELRPRPIWPLVRHLLLIMVN